MLLSQESVLQHWAGRGRPGHVLTDADREQVVARIRQEIEDDGQRWPGRVVWVGSPGELERCRSGRSPWGRRRPVLEEVGPGPRADPAYGWIVTRSRLVICEPPRVVRTEPVGSAGRRRLHHESGPAVEWSGSGPPGYYLHGVAIPEHLFVEPTAAAIHGEVNSEVRRLVIERMGWLKYIQDADLQLVSNAADPGNPGHELLLYDLPKGRYEPARVLLMVNGSPDRSGDRRQYAELVPDWIDDPVRAAAWQYGCPVEIYRRLARRT